MTSDLMTVDFKTHFASKIITRLNQSQIHQSLFNLINFPQSYIIQSFLYLFNIIFYFYKLVERL